MSFIHIIIVVITFNLVNGQYYDNNGLPSMMSNTVPGQNDNIRELNYCRISTRDLVSTAKNIATRTLQGVCNPRDLGRKFSDLEAQLTDQFNVLKTMVLNIEDKLTDQLQKIKGQHKKLHKSIITRTQRREGGQNNIEKNIDDPSSFLTEDNKNSAYDDINYAIYGPVIDDKEGDARVQEILKLNSTTHVKNGSTVFTYYWKIKDLRYRMKKWGWKRSLRSDSFYIFQHGYKMYIRIFPNHDGQNVYIHVGLTKGKYDFSLSWPFRLKHKIQILDHRVDGEDLSSRLWDPDELCSAWNWKKPERGDNYECVGLGFPQEILFTRNYLYQDSIVVKFTVFLD